jgi:hypothetical protein
VDVSRPLFSTCALSTLTYSHCPRVRRDDPPLLGQVEVVPSLPGVFSALGAEVPLHERAVGLLRSLSSKSIDPDANPGGEPVHMLGGDLPHHDVAKGLKCLGVVWAWAVAWHAASASWSTWGGLCGCAAHGRRPASRWSPDAGSRPPRSVICIVRGRTSVPQAGTSWTTPSTPHRSRISATAEINSSAQESQTSSAIRNP